MNVLSSLRLAERCADILISVREEIFDAGDVVGQELAAPIQKLEEYVVCSRTIVTNCSYLIIRSFEGVHHFLIKQSNRPFLKRYLRRDQILRDISDCDSSLRDALGLFSVSFFECLQRVLY
jgi:abelson tyrosine-protein kinase 1